MGKSLGLRIRLGSAFGFAGISIAVANKTFPESFLYWIACACIGIAGGLFLLSFVSWAIAKFSLREWVAGAIGATLLVVTLVTALVWASLDPAAPTNSPGQGIASPKPPARQTRGTGGVLKETLPGYTSTLLMQIDKIRSDQSECIFQDASAGGSTVSLFS